MPPEEGATNEEIVDAKLDALLDNPPVTDPAQEVKPEGDKPEETPEGDKPKGEEKAEEEEPEKEAEGESITLSDLSAVLGIEEDKLDVVDGKVYLKTKIDGEEGKVSLQDAHKSYQLEGHLNKQNMEVVEQRKALESEREAFNQERQAKIQQLEDTLSLAVNELNRDFQSTDWNTLKSEDPTQYTLSRQEYSDRQTILQQSYQTLISTRDSEARVFHEKRVKRLESESLKLKTLIPGWDKEESYKAGALVVRQTLLDHGFSNEDVEAISQGLSMPPEMATKIFVLTHKAAEYDKLQKSKAEVEKKIRKAPVIVKSGVLKSTDKKITSITKALDLVKKTGGEKGLDEYLEAKGII